MRPSSTPQTRIVVGAAVVSLAIGGSVPFFTATTFITDDHLFLAFARYAPNPLVAFVRDQLGGECYRPLPMLLWWVLERLAGPSAAAFAALACLLHLIVSIQVGALVLCARRDARAALLAAGLFYVAPGTREAAYWYAASTDLLATAFGVGAILALFRARLVLASLCFAAACASKESAIVVPALAAVALRAREPGLRATTLVRRLAPLLAVGAAYLGVRTFVLRGIGGFGDAHASPGAKLLQISSALLHVATGQDALGGDAAWIAGGVVWIALLLALAWPRRGEPRPAFSSAPLVWAVLAVLPLLAAPWIVGGRYVYLAAVGVAWLAAESLRRTSIVATVAVFSVLAGLASAQAVERRTEVVAYQTRLAAARRAVKGGLADGHTTFHIASGIKDLDLAIKEDPELSRAAPALAVLTDVPASFVALTGARAGELDFLLARPPLPTSGGYRFGDYRIAALARRGDDPSLDEVVARLPDIRFIRLRLGPAGRVVYRDVTEARRLEDREPEPE
jgi:hypothetical protein